MKKNELTEIKTKTVDELKRMFLDLNEEVGKLKMENAKGKLKNTNIIKMKKKVMTRVLTFLSMKEISEAAETVAGRKVEQNG